MKFKYEITYAVVGTSHLDARGYYACTVKKHGMKTTSFAKTPLQALLNVLCIKLTGECFADWEHAEKAREELLAAGQRWPADRAGVAGGLPPDGHPMRVAIEAHDDPWTLDQ